MVRKVIYYLVDLNILVLGVGFLFILRIVEYVVLFDGFFVVMENRLVFLLNIFGMCKRWVFLFIVI